MKKFIICGLGLIVIACYLSVSGSLKLLKITKTDVYFENLPKELDGLKILHISDLHGNSSDKMNLDIWERVFSQEFDIAVITGDVVITEIEQIEPHMENIKKLAKKVPTYYVNGNHELKFTRKMLEKMKSAGLHTLDNSAEFLNINNISVPVIGFRDHYYLKRDGFDYLYALFKKYDKRFKIVLSHQPQVFDNFDEYSDLIMFSGHTHGGQLRFPFFPTLYAPGQGFFPKYGNGLYERGEAKLYISKGIGTTDFPIRFFNRPEIAIITLKQKQ